MNKQKRHIRKDFHYVRQEVAAGHIKMKYVKSKENPADGFTKALGGPDHAEFVKLLNLEFYG